MAEEKKALGNEAYKAQDFNGAIALYTEAIELTDTEEKVALAVLYGNIAAAYLSLKKYPETISACEKALENDPTYAKPYLRISTALNNMGKKQQALEVCFNAMRIFKPSANSKKNRTAGYNDLKKLHTQIKQELDQIEAQSQSNNRARKPLNEQEMKAIEELQSTLHDNLLRGQKARKEKSRAEIAAKRIELTLQQMNQLPETSNSFLSVGRMFYKMSTSDAVESLVAEKELAVDTKDKMQKMEEFYDKKIRNVESNIREIVQGS